MAAVALVAAIIVSAGAGYLVGTSNRGTVTSVSTTTLLTTTTSTAISKVTTTMMVGSPLAAYVVEPNGLNFSISINATSLDPTERIELTASLTNTLANSNNVTAADCYKFLGYHLDPSPAGYWEGPYLFVVLNGSYSAESVVGLGGNGSAESGFSAEYARVWSYRFGPMSNSAVLSAEVCTASCSNGTLGPYPSSASVTVRGYWSMPVKTSSYPRPPNALAPGVYTVAVEDQWGSVLVLHFTVAGSQTASTPVVCWPDEQTCST